MPIKILIPTVLQKLTKNKQEIEIEKEKINNISEVLDELDELCPGIKDRLCDKEGKLRPFVNIFLNGEDIRFLNHESTEIKDNDEVSIIPAIAGGKKDDLKKWQS